MNILINISLSKAEVNDKQTQITVSLKCTGNVSQPPDCVDHKRSNTNSIRMIPIRNGDIFSNTSLSHPLNCDIEIRYDIIPLVQQWQCIFPIDWPSSDAFKSNKSNSKCSAIHSHFYFIFLLYRCDFNNSCACDCS